MNYEIFQIKFDKNQKIKKMLWIFIKKIKLSNKIQIYLINNK